MTEILSSQDKTATPSDETVATTTPAGNKPAIKSTKLEMVLEVHERLRVQARRIGLTVTGYIRQAVLERLERDERRRPPR